MKKNIQVTTLPSGELQVRLDSPMTGAELVEELGFPGRRTRHWRF